MFHELKTLILAGNFDSQVRLSGIQDAARTVETRHGRPMRFMTFEDETGVFEACLFPDTYRQLRGRLNDLGPYIIDGQVQTQYDGPRSHVRHSCFYH